MDPLADKLLVLSALILLVQFDWLPGWLVIVILGREMAVSSMRALAASKGLVIPAGNLGKIKTMMQMPAIAALIFFGPASTVGLISVGLIYASVFVSLSGMVSYYQALADVPEGDVPEDKG